MFTLSLLDSRASACLVHNAAHVKKFEKGSNGNQYTNVLSERVRGCQHGKDHFEASQNVETIGGINANGSLWIL